MHTILQYGGVILAITATVAAVMLAVAHAAARKQTVRLSQRLSDLQREIGVRECIERQLQASQSNLQIATDASGVGTWYWELSTDDVTCSDQVFRLFGLPKSDRIPKISDFLSMVHPDDQERMRSSIEKAGREGGYIHIDYRVMRADKKTTWLSTSARAFMDPDHQVRRIAGITADITDHKQLEESFYQAQKMEAVGRLAGGVAHDFNNMLGVISAYAELLREDPSISTKAVTRVDEIINATVRANALTRQLLAFSRKQVINPTTLDLNAVISGVKDMVQRLVGEDIKVETRLTPDIGHVKADRGQLEQVLLNFAANSRDAMPGGGRFQMRTSVLFDPQGDRICLQISDTGEGMSPEVMKHIFEPFFTTKAAGRGTGLGLATVYGVIEQAQGTIQVDSELGKGTTFTILLPIVAASKPEPTAVARKVIAAPSAKILLVEDESSLRDVLTEFMQAAGMHVETATNGREALAKLASDNSFEVLLTDLVMPEMDGRTLAQNARAQHPNLQVIFMSGHTDDTLMHKALIDDGLTYLQKPFTRNELITALNAILRPV